MEASVRPSGQGWHPSDDIVAVVAARLTMISRDDVLGIVTTVDGKKDSDRRKTGSAADVASATVKGLENGTA